jgi:hypothetical protein
MTLDPTMLLAAERQRGLQADAAKRALIRVATCCHPSAVRQWLRAWQERRRPAITCCA